MCRKYGCMGWFEQRLANLDGVNDFDVMIRKLANTMLPLGAVVAETTGDAVVVGGIHTTLTNLRRAWVEQPAEDRIPWLERTVRALVNPQPIPDALDTTRLRPSISSRKTLGLAALRSMAEGDSSSLHEIPHRPIAGDLTWTLVWDTPATMDLVTEEQLEVWGVDFDALLQAAKMNLALAPFLGWEVVEDRIFAPKGIDDYDGARVFLPGQLDFLPFSEERVVFHPARPSCAVMSIDDEDAIAAAAANALSHVGTANRVSLPPLVGHTGHWRPLRLDPEHRAYDTWSRLVTYDQAAAYETQHRLLEPMIGPEVFAASYVPIEQSSGALSSYCTWTRGVEALLPETDRVAFYEEDAEPFLVPWDVAHEVVGHLMEATEHQPSRWRVVEYPTTTELSILRNASM